MSESPRSNRTWSSSRPSTSADSCVITVRVPVPMPCLTTASRIAAGPPHSCAAATRAGPCLPAVTLAGLAFLEVNAQHADPEAKGLLGVIGRKIHQGDRMPRHGVKTHSRRVAALDHRRPNPQSESVGTYVQQILLAALIEPCANWRVA